jgi:hypothetical protein
VQSLIREDWASFLKEILNSVDGKGCFEKNHLPVVNLALKSVVFVTHVWKSLWCSKSLEVSSLSPPSKGPLETNSETKSRDPSSLPPS